MCIADQFSVEAEQLNGLDCALVKKVSSTLSRKYVFTRKVENNALVVSEFN